MALIKRTVLRRWLVVLFSLMHAGEAIAESGTGKQRDIPSLDGLRAVSILTVVLAHSAWFLPRSLTGNRFYRFTLGNGGSGVTVFFVISGFLITNLLLRELDNSGGMSLSRFYMRRSLRIFPAFYLYVATVALLMWKHVLPAMNVRSFIASASYTWCYYPAARGYFLQHSWSLSVEEQFYIFWPALLGVLYKRNQIIQASLGIVVLMPVVRLLFYWRYPQLRGLDYYLIFGWMDTMMVGCMLALLHRRKEFLPFKQWFLKPEVAFALAAIAFYGNPALSALLRKPYSGFYTMVFYPFTTAVCIAGVLLFVVERPRSVAGRLLNTSWVRRIGVLSYSLYLWQQLFLSEHLHLLPYGYILLFLASAASFWLVEQPFLSLRKWIEQRDILAPRRIADGWSVSKDSSQSAGAMTFRSGR